MSPMLDNTSQLRWKSYCGVGGKGGGGKILWESSLQRHPTITLLMCPTLLFYFVQHQAIFLVKGRVLLPINGTLNINEK